MFDIWSGPLMDEAGDTGGGGGGGSDLGGGGESTALTTTADTSLATVQTDPGSEESTDLTTTEETSLESRPVTATSKALEPLKASHPQLYRQIPRDMAVAARLRGMFPGMNPFDGINAALKRVKQLGGEDGIAELQGQVADIKELDALYAKGDPRMFDRMTETPEGKSAFVKLAPHAIALFEKLAPKAFSKYFAKMIIDEITGQRIDMRVQRMAELTPKEFAAADGTKTANPAVAELTALQAWFDRLVGLEKLEPEVIASPDTKDPLENDRKELARQKAEIRADNWKTAADKRRDALFTETWTKETKGLKISVVDKEDIIARFGLRLPKALEAIPGFSNTLKEFFEADDRDGYLRFLQAKYAETIPRVLKTEVQRRYKPANGTPSQRTETTATAVRTAPEIGFKSVSIAPHMNTVDMRPGKTSPDMWKKGRAVLKDGSKIQWA